jgi:hypothetical protein
LLLATLKHKSRIVAADTQENLTARFIDELTDIANPERQTEQEAEALLAKVESLFAGENAEIASAMSIYDPRRPARRRLACLLLSVEDVSVLAQILHYFTALTD